MNAFRARKTTGQSVRGSNARVFLALMIAAAFAGILLLAGAEAAAQSAGVARQTANAPTGNAERGKATYKRVGCWECHGFDAQSGGGTGPKLGPPPMPFAAFTNQLRSPRNQMPPYTAKVLSDADIADIYAFVQSLPQPPKVESTPLLQ
jgi:ubiquinol-cytochrome c reductase cytochrome c subunit